MVASSTWHVGLLCSPDVSLPAMCLLNRWVNFARSWMEYIAEWSGKGEGKAVPVRTVFLVFVAIRTLDFAGGSESLYRSRPWSNLRYWGHLLGETEETLVKVSLRQWFCVVKGWSSSYVQMLESRCDVRELWVSSLCIPGCEGRQHGRLMYYLWQCVHGKGVRPWGKLSPVPSFLPIKKFSFFHPPCIISQAISIRFLLVLSVPLFLFIFTSLCP